MTLRTADGTALDKAALTALTTQQSAEPPDRVLDAAIYETFPLPGERDYESGKRLKYRDGKRITQAELDALFPTATVTSFTPDNGGTAGGETVTIVGTNLTGVQGVTFGADAATSVEVVSDTRVTCVTPAHAAGAVDVTVADDNDDVVVADGYTYA